MPCVPTSIAVALLLHESERKNPPVRCVDTWIRDGRIPFLKIGRTVLIPWREALETLNRDYRLNARSEQEERL